MKTMKNNNKNKQSYEKFKKGYKKPMTLKVGNFMASFKLNKGHKLAFIIFLVGTILDITLSLYVHNLVPVNNFEVNPIFLEYGKFYPIIILNVIVLGFVWLALGVFNKENQSLKPVTFWQDFQQYGIIHLMMTVTAIRLWVVRNAILLIAVHRESPQTLIDLSNAITPQMQQQALSSVFFTMYLFPVAIGFVSFCLWRWSKN